MGRAGVALGAGVLVGGVEGGGLAGGAGAGGAVTVTVGVGDAEVVGAAGVGRVEATASSPMPTRSGNATTG